MAPSCGPVAQGARDPATKIHLTPQQFRPKQIGKPGEPRDDALGDRRPGQRNKATKVGSSPRSAISGIAPESSRCGNVALNSRAPSAAQFDAGRHRPALPALAQAEPSHVLTRRSETAAI